MNPVNLRYFGNEICEVRIKSVLLPIESGRIHEMERYISQTLHLAEHAVANTLKLLAEGATIPFISRYRKEATGGLDEVQIAAIDTAYKKLQELEKRKETVLATIEEQGKLTDELRSRILRCVDATELEDIYLPYKPKLPAASKRLNWYTPVGNLWVGTERLKVVACMVSVSMSSHLPWCISV